METRTLKSVSETTSNEHFGIDADLLLLASHPMLQAALWIYKVVLVVVFIAGIIGNAMILVLQRRLDNGRSSSLSVFIYSLAVSDSVMLVVSGVSWYAAFTFRFFVIDYHDVLCKVVYWVVYVTGLTSGWILVVMTMQRASSIVWPHRVNAMWTARRAEVTVACLVIIAMLVNSHILYGRTLQVFPNGRVLCLFVSEDYQTFFNDVWPSVDSVLSAFGPFVLIIGSNVVLIKSVRQSVQEARASLAVGTSDQLKVREKKTSSMTVTLVCISVAFLVLTSPLCVFMTVQRTASHSIAEDVDEAAANYLVETIGNILWLTNNGINFYLYLLTGSRYRAALAAMCSCCRLSVRQGTRSTPVDRD